MNFNENQPNNKKISELLGKLSPKDAIKVKNILSDSKKTHEILQTKEAQAIIKKLSKNTK